MKKRPIILVVLALILATLYIANFTDWLKAKNIHIRWRISRLDSSVVTFDLGDKEDTAYALTSVKVVSTEEARTNKYPHALWHMVAVDAPPLTETFNYGGLIPGMKPEVATALPDPLQPDTDYSVIVETANGLKGEKSFMLH
jgi:hypothetical protein